MILVQKWRVLLVTSRPSEARADVRGFHVSTHGAENAMVLAVLEAQRQGYRVHPSRSNGARVEA